MKKIIITVILSGVFTASSIAANMSKAALMKEGKKVYSDRCLVCHKASGKGMPPTFPALIGGKITTGTIKNHLNIVINGKKGTAMVPFGTILTNKEIAAVITYQRNSWGNNDKKKYGKQAGGIVQPDDVAKAKKGN